VSAGEREDDGKNKYKHIQSGSDEE